MINSVELTVYVFSNVGNIFLRAENRIIQIPSVFVPSRSPLGGFDINTKLIDNVNEIGVDVYLRETMSELSLIISGESAESAELTTDDGETLMTDDGEILVMD